MTSEHLGNEELLNRSRESAENETPMDPEARDIMERLEIVQKYDKGPEQDVDPWENPDFEVYQVTDRFGFMHDQPIDSPDGIHLKEKLKELEREKKWLKMRPFNTTDKIKLKKRVYKGIPDKFRGETWAHYLKLDDNDETKRRERKERYEQLCLRARLSSEHIKQIDLDINRTYRNHLSFRRRYDISQQSLFHVLAAYSVYNTEVGYCQGMSQITAILLMYFKEEDAFWALHQLMVGEHHLMHGFFVPGFPKLMRLQTHHERVLKKLLSSIYKHFNKVGLQSGLYITKWFLNCFLDRLPFTLALRVWDVFIMEGDRILTAMAYNIMKMHKSVLVKASFEAAARFLQSDLEHDFGYSDKVAMESLRTCVGDLIRAKLLIPNTPPTADERPQKPLGTILSQSLGELERHNAHVIGRAKEKQRAAAGARRQSKGPGPRSPGKVGPEQVTQYVTVISTGATGSPSRPPSEHPPDPEPPRALSPIARIERPPSPYENVSAAGGDRDISNAGDLVHSFPHPVSPSYSPRTPPGPSLSPKETVVFRPQSRHDYYFTPKPLMEADGERVREEEIIRSYPSFYDNVPPPPSTYTWVEPLALRRGSSGRVQVPKERPYSPTEYTTTEEEIQYQTSPDGRTFTTHYTRTTRNVSTVSRRSTSKNDGDECEGRSLEGSSRGTSPEDVVISSKMDNVTRVRIPSNISTNK